MKKVFKFLLAVSLPFLLVSCNSGSNENNSDNNSTQNPDADTNTDDTTNNGENSGNGDIEDKKIPTYTGMSVSDTVEKTAVPQGQIRKAASTNYDFYVQAKSTFYIEIHLDNPSQYEILSFTLNDVKYQSYEFNKGSNSELLILEAKAPDTAGNKIFNLSNIKYVDGESIKDVDLSSAKRSIDVGITYAELPSVNIINENVSYTSYDALFDVDAKDIPDFKYECVIYDENNKEVSTFSSGSTTYNLSVKANKLKMNSTYTYEFIGTFDYYDGKGTTEHSFGEGTFTTLDGVKIINESVTSTSFSFEYDIKEPSVQISNIYYVDTVDNSVTKCDVSSTNISGLKSNRDYNLNVSYTYGEFSGHLETDFKTLAKQPGSYTVSNVTPTANSVSFSLNIDDEDGATNISSITLYDEETGQKVKTLTNTTNLRFNDLYSNHNYRIEVLYYNNLNDGSSNQYSTIIETFTTLANTAPSYSFVLGNTSYTTADISFNENDPSDIGNVESFELYRNDSLVPELTTKTFEEMSEKLKNLYSASKYTLKANYSYDLNEGEGEVDKSISIEFYTSKYDAPTFNINVENIGFDNVSFSIDQSGYEDLISKTLKVVNKETEEVLYTTNKFALNNSIFVNGLNSNSTYEIIIEYSYDLNDSNGVINQTVSSEFTTSKYDEPIVNVSTSGIGYNTICFFVNYSNFKIITDSVVTVAVKDSEEIISSFEVNTNGQKFILDNLDENTEYTIKVDYTYDYYDGHGPNKGSIETTMNTLNIEDFNFEFDVIPSNTSLELKIRYENSEDSLIHANNIEVKDFETNEIVKTVDFYDAIYSFGPGYYYIYELLSNHKYLVTFNYSLANYNGVIEKHSFSKEITTLKNYEPYVYLSTSYVGSNFANFYFGVNVSGDTTVEAANVYLYDNDGKLLQTSNNFVNDPGYSQNYITFTGLEPNSSYFAVAEYKYNLKDGNGWSDIKTTEKCKFNTYSNNTYNASLLAVGKDSASISLTSTREMHCNIVLKSAYLCKKDDSENIINKFEFNTKDDQIINLTNLLSNTEYILVYYYDFEYLLNGSIGILNNLKQTFSFRTNPETLPQVSIDYEVIDSSIKYNIDIIKGDEKGILERVELLDENNFAIYCYGPEAYTGQFNYLESNTKYHIRVTYRYTLNDGKGEYLYSVMENGYATLNGVYVFNENYYKKLGAIDVIISDNKLYAIFSGRGYSWDDCVKMCEEMGGHLITTNDDNEEAILDELLDSTNNLNSWIGGYYEDDSWHWISGEEFVFDQDNFYYPSTVDPNNGDVLKSWFDVAKYWYAAPTIGSDEQVAYVLELDIGGASNTWIEIL